MLQDANLTSADHRLLSTVVTESALLPDLMAMGGTMPVFISFSAHRSARARRVPSHTRVSRAHTRGPNVALYDASADRVWDAKPGEGMPSAQWVHCALTMHLGFFVSTMLHEYAVHRSAGRRFTVLHVMVRMGFGAADMNLFSFCNRCRVGCGMPTRDVPR